MIGAITGDVLGSVYEGAMMKRKDFRLFNTLNRPTDDSVLTLAVADAILRADDAPTEADFAASLREKGRRYPRAGYGGSFRRWIEDSTMGAYQSWGNGSAMRASAVGWAYESVEDVLRVAELSARPTHDHREGIKGAQSVALAVFLARHGASREELRLEIAHQFGYDLDRTVDEIRPGYAFEISCQRSVPESIIAFLDSTDFEDAIRNAISLGGDADTQACIAGAVAEAFYGGVPESMLAWVLPRLDSSQLRIAREFAGRFMTETRVAQIMDRLVGDRLPGGRDAGDEVERPSSRGPEFRIVLSGETWGRIEEYAERLGSSHEATTGRRVADQLEILTRVPGDDDGSATREPDRQPVTPAILLDALLNSKCPRIFAESEVRGDGSDWTTEELGLLGDLGVAVPVTVYDDARHRNPRVHESPLTGTLLFVPGALLRADSAAVAADWDAVVRGDAIDQDRYAALYERRLVPLLSYASARALAFGR
ncbi:MAG: ADP-ribosylglycohydrolase family protein, partial [Spirochaetota bacterium]